MCREAGDGTWWVYMISCRGGKLYTGTAKDPQERFRTHRKGKGAAFTRANPPQVLLRCVSYGTRSEACRAEAALKKMTREGKLAWATGVGMRQVPRVNKRECIACGVCVDIAPAVFRFDADNRAEVYDPEGADASVIQEAIELCPVSCIYWED